MSEILFIRHAETDMSGTFCGHSDPPLNSRGMAQASDLVRGLQSECIHNVYTSDLSRAYQTAMILASSFKADCHSRPALREINFGQWEGLTWSAIQQIHLRYSQCWIDQYPNLPAPDGERFSDFKKRALDEIALLVRSLGGRSIAVVTHAGVLRLVLCHLLETSEEQSWQLTSSYCSIVRYQPPMQLLSQSEEKAS